MSNNGKKITPVNRLDFLKMEDTVLTPEIEKRKLDVLEEELKFEREELKFERQNEYKVGCCMTNRRTDRRLLKFLTQMTISLFAITFSMYQLSGHRLSCEQSSPYVALLSSTVALWFNAPSLGT